MAKKAVQEIMTLMDKAEYRSNRLATIPDSEGWRGKRGLNLTREAEKYLDYNSRCCFKQCYYAQLMQLQFSTSISYAGIVRDDCQYNCRITHSRVCPESVAV